MRMIMLSTSSVFAVIYIYRIYIQAYEIHAKLDTYEHMYSVIYILKHQLYEMINERSVKHVE